MIVPFDRFENTGGEGDNRTTRWHTNMRYVCVDVSFVERPDTCNETFISTQRINQKPNKSSSKQTENMDSAVVWSPEELAQL